MMHVFHYAIFLAWLFCFIYVVVKMFQNGSTVLGIVCLVTGCCAIGPIIAFVVGWMRSSQWNIRGLMTVWTVALIANIVLHFVSPSPVVEQVRQQVRQFQAK